MVELCGHCCLSIYPNTLSFQVTACEHPVCEKCITRVNWPYKCQFLSCLDVCESTDRTFIDFTNEFQKTRQAIPMMLENCSKHTKLPLQFVCIENNCKRYKENLCKVCFGELHLSCGINNRVEWKQVGIYWKINFEHILGLVERFIVKSNETQIGSEIGLKLRMLVRSTLVKMTNLQFVHDNIEKFKVELNESHVFVVRSLLLDKIEGVIKGLDPIQLNLSSQIVRQALRQLTKLTKLNFYVVESKTGKRESTINQQNSQSRESPVRKNGFEELCLKTIRDHELFKKDYPILGRIEDYLRNPKPTGHSLAMSIILDRLQEQNEHNFENLTNDKNQSNRNKKISKRPKFKKPKPVILKKKTANSISDITVRRKNKTALGILEKSENIEFLKHKPEPKIKLASNKPLRIIKGRSKKTGWGKWFGSRSKLFNRLNENNLPKLPEFRQFHSSGLCFDKFSIIQDKHLPIIISFFEEPVIFKLIYQTPHARDFFENFKNKCGKAQETIVFIKTKKCIVGGFNDIPWDRPLNFPRFKPKTGPLALTWKPIFRQKSFLFCLETQKKYIFKNGITREEYAPHQSQKAPNFGTGIDLCIIREKGDTRVFAKQETYAEDWDEIAALDPEMFKDGSEMLAYQCYQIIRGTNPDS